MKHIVSIIFILVGIVGMFVLGVKELMLFGYIGCFIIYFEYIYKSKKLYINLLIMISGAYILGLLWQQDLVSFLMVLIFGVIAVFGETYKIANMWDEYEKKE